MKKPIYVHSLEKAKLANDTEIGAIYGEVFRTMPVRVALNVGETLDFKFTCNSVTKLINRIISVSAGGVTYEVFVGATPTAAAKTPVTMFGVNGTNIVAAKNLFEVGAINAPLFTGGTIIDLIDVVTGQGGNGATIPDEQVGGRALASGAIFYLRFTGLSASSKAILFLLLQELTIHADNLKD